MYTRIHIVILMFMFICLFIVVLIYMFILMSIFIFVFTCIVTYLSVYDRFRSIAEGATERAATEVF